MCGERERGVCTWSLTCGQMLTAEAIRLEQERSLVGPGPTRPTLATPLPTYYTYTCTHRI